MKVRRTNKGSYGFHQPKDTNSEDIISKNGKILDEKSLERGKAFDGYIKEVNKSIKVDREASESYKETKSGNLFRVGRHSKNPFKDGIVLNVYTNKEKDRYGRRMPISTSSKDSVKAFKEYLKLKDSAGLNEKIDNKEIKDEIRRVAKKKAIQRGAIVGGVVGGTIAAGIGAKKLYDKKKKKK